MVRLFVGGLPPDVTAEAVVQRFTPFGEVSACEVIPAKDPTGQHQGCVTQPACRGFAYVELHPRDETTLGRCLSLYNHSKWRGHVLRVEMAKQHHMAKLQQEWEAEAAGTWVPPSRAAARKRRAAAQQATELDTAEASTEPWDGIPQPLNTEEPLRLVLGYKRRKAKVMVVPLDAPSTAKNVKRQFPTVSTLPLGQLSWEDEQPSLTRHIERLNELWYLKGKAYQPANSMHDRTQHEVPDMATLAMEYEKPKPATDVSSVQKHTQAQLKTTTAKSQEQQAYLKILKSINTASQKEEAAAAAAAAAARGLQRAKQKAKASKTGGRHQLAPLVQPASHAAANQRAASVVTFADDDMDDEDMAAPADLDRFGSDSDTESNGLAKQQPGSKASRVDEQQHQILQAGCRQQPGSQMAQQRTANTPPESSEQFIGEEESCDDQRLGDDEQDSALQDSGVQGRSHDDQAGDQADDQADDQAEVMMTRQNDITDEGQHVEAQPSLRTQANSSDEEGVSDGGMSDETPHGYNASDALEDHYTTDDEMHQALEEAEKQHQAADQAVAISADATVRRSKQEPQYEGKRAQQKQLQTRSAIASKHACTEEILVPPRSQQQQQRRGATLGLASMFDDDSDSEEVFHDVDDSETEQPRSKQRAGQAAKLPAKGVNNRSAAGADAAQVGRKAGNKPGEQGVLAAQLQAQQKSKLGRQEQQEPPSTTLPAAVIHAPAALGKQLKAVATNAQGRKQQPASSEAAAEPCHAAAAEVRTSSPSTAEHVVGQSTAVVFQAALLGNDAATATPLAPAAPLVAQEQRILSQQPAKPNRASGHAASKKPLDAGTKPTRSTFMKSSNKAVSAPATPAPAQTPAVTPTRPATVHQLQLPAGLQYATSFMRTQSLQAAQAQWTMQRAALATDVNPKQRKQVPLKR